MDNERPPRTAINRGTSSELFICFTSRLSSSSMKISSKSILSPNRPRDQPVSLSNSLSRRLRNSGSIKGGQASPMFPAGGKKRGCAFENPEPSSPKVTCIGQVRVKTKKQGNKMRSLSKRRGGEVSFRKVEQNREGLNQNQSHTQSSQPYQYQQQQQECLPHRNQRWVHLPLTICEALRAFGAEFSCLFPCRSSCFSTSERGKEEKERESSEGTGQSSCGAVFARWLVALQDGEGGKRREIELVVGGEEERTDLTEKPARNSRRHVFDEIDFEDEECGVKDEIVEEEEARVSICIPPKNALLLMRCRSDPMRMSALANRFCELSVPKNEEEDDDKEDNEENACDVPEDQVDEEYKVEDEVKMEQTEDEVSEMLDSVEDNEEQENPEAETALELEVQEGEEENAREKLQISEEVHEEKQETQEVEADTQVEQTQEEESAVSGSSSESVVDQQNTDNDDNDNEQIREEEEESRASYYSSPLDSDGEGGEPEAEAVTEEAALEQEEAEKSNMAKETQERPSEDEQTATQERSEPDEIPKIHEEEEEECTKSEKEDSEIPVLERASSSVLPDCLLLMMCEPKLSMEVSKETWVCSTDFIRWGPEKQVNPKNAGDEPKKKISTETDSIPPPHQHTRATLQQPARSSCSLPAPATAINGVSMATMIEQKLVNAAAYEPIVLTRCKSEPMRRAAKLAPEACFWKNRKLEPHHGANIGVGAAGVGF